MSATARSSQHQPSPPWPGPRGNWLLGCLRQIQNDPLTLYRAAWREHGDYVRVRIVPGMFLYLVAHPEAIEQILFKNHKNYRIAFEYVSHKMNGRLMPPLGIPTRRNREFKRSIGLLDRVVIQIIESRRKSQTPINDLLGLLLAAHDEESGAGMTDQQLKDEVITLLTAGHETNGAALSWSWYLLGQHADVQEALRDEAAGRLQGRTPTIEDLPHLPLARAVFEESMRLYPPAWGMPREAIEADDLQGHPVPKGAIFTLAQFLTHRHPDFWTEPDRFDPTRFLSAQAQTRHKCAYFPFGGGPRICIGNHLAMIEGTLVLAALAQRFHFTLVPGQTVAQDATFTLRPKSGVQVIIRKRS